MQAGQITLEDRWQRHRKPQAGLRFKNKSNELSVDAGADVKHVKVNTFQLFPRKSSALGTRAVQLVSLEISLICPYNYFDGQKWKLAF